MALRPATCDNRKVEGRGVEPLSDRLQKVSGAEAIFRELGFCEDVLESEGRDRLRSALEGGG